MLIRFFSIIAMTLVANTNLILAASNETSDFEGGLPQFNYSRFPEQVFWFLLIFCILYIILVKFVIPTIRNIKHSRERFIDENLFYYNKNNSEVNKLSKQISEAFKKANIDSKEYLNNLVKELSQKEQERLNTIKNSNNKVKQELLSEIKLYNKDFNDHLPNLLKENISLLLNKINITIDQSIIDNYVKQQLNKENNNV
ncbi:hypothetical protein ACFX5K_05995 [Rickettsiales bacterium LUAb2]